MDQWLLAFVTVAAQGGFSRAAVELSITQPALSKQIQALERRLGGQLFVRGRHGAVPTELGAALLPSAHDLVAATEGFVQRAQRLAAGRTGRLDLGFGLSSIEVAPRAVAMFRHSYPEVEVTLEDMGSSTQFERIAHGELQAGFARLPAAGRLAACTVHHDQLALAQPAASPKLEVAQLPAALATGHLVRLARPRGPGLAAQIDLICGAWGVEPGTLQEAHDLQTILALVAAGTGPALVPASAAAIAPAGAVLTPIDHPAATWDIGIVWDPHRVSPVLGNFLSLILPG